MGPAIQKQMIEIVYINLPGPEEPNPTNERWRVDSWLPFRNGANENTWY